MRYFKGLTAVALLWILPSLAIFIFDSCKKANYENSKTGEAARKFNQAIELTRPILGSLILDKSNSFQSRFTGSMETYYVDFPTATTPEVINDFSSNVTIQTLTNVLTNYRVSIDDSVNSNAEVVISIPAEQIRTTLQPLVVEAKNYLYAKGITNQQINDMLIEENAEEIDLIPYVKALAAIEQEQYIAKNISMPFVNNANALPAFVECGLYALGGDALYALSQSTASVWTWAAMKSAFKTVAKKFLGPIGVAVAVVSFGVCMLGHI